jgi:hypothetical protein
METHSRFIGEEKTSFAMSRLEQLGFRIVEKTGFVVVLER